MADDYRLEFGSPALDIVTDLQFVAPIDWFGSIRKNLPFNAGIYEGPAISDLPTEVTPDEDEYNVDVAYDATMSDESLPSLSTHEFSVLKDVRKYSEVRAGHLVSGSSNHSKTDAYRTIIARLPFNKTGYINSFSITVLGTGTIKLKELVSSTSEDFFSVNKELGDFSVTNGVNNLSIDPVKVGRFSYIGIYTDVPVAVSSNDIGNFWSLGTEVIYGQEETEFSKVDGYDLCLYASDCPVIVVPKGKKIGALIDLGETYKIGDVRIRSTVVDSGAITISTGNNIAALTEKTVQTVRATGMSGPSTAAKTARINQSGLYIMRKYTGTSEAALRSISLSINSAGNSSYQLRLYRYESGLYRRVQDLSSWVTAVVGNKTILAESVFIMPNDYIAIAVSLGDGDLIFNSGSLETIKDTCYGWRTAYDSNSFSADFLTDGSGDSTASLSISVIESILADCSDDDPVRYVRFDVQELSSQFMVFGGIEIRPSSNRLGYGSSGTLENSFSSEDHASGEISSWYPIRIFNDSEQTANRIDISLVPEGKDKGSKFCELSNLQTGESIVRNCKNNLGILSGGCSKNNARYTFPYGEDKDAPECGITCPEWEADILSSVEAISAGSLSTVVEQDKFAGNPIANTDYGASSYVDGSEPFRCLNGDSNDYWQTQESNNHFIWVLFDSHYNIKKINLLGTGTASAIYIYVLSEDGSPQVETSWSLAKTLTTVNLATLNTVYLNIAKRTRGIKVSFVFDSEISLTLNKLELQSFTGYSSIVYMRTVYPDSLSQKRRSARLRTKLVY